MRSVACPPFDADGFSALQRAENSSIAADDPHLCFNAPVSVLFSEPKIPQSRRWSVDRFSARRRFSALQRAENSSINASADAHFPALVFQCSSASRKFLNHSSERIAHDVRVFQCSSASRKFLNERSRPACGPHAQRFSALQRAENSSIPTLAPASIHIPDCDDHASSFLSLPGASP